ncbi:MAG: glycosyltransferase family 4 protein [bacterium]
MQHISIIKSKKSPYYGGRDKQLICLAAAWVGAGKNIAVFSNCAILREEAKKKEIGYKKIWLGCEPIGFKNSLVFTLLFPFLFLYSLAFAIILKFREKIDTLYLANMPEKILLTIPARLLGVNVIWEEFYISSEWHIFNPFRLLWIINARAAKIFTFSNAAKNILIKKGLPKKIKVIYPGINLAEFENQQSLFTSAEDQNLNSKNLFKIGVICRLTKKNGLEYLLQALKIIVELIPEAQLVIIGTGDERFNLNWLVKKLDLAKHIWFMGYQENYCHWLKNFDLFIMPSVVNQSINIAIIEAMAYFCPVIASNLSGIDEIVKHTQSGILVPPGNPEILAQVIIQLYRDKTLRDEMGKNGYNRVRSVFNIERVMEDLERI